MARLTRNFKSKPTSVWLLNSITGFNFSASAKNFSQSNEEWKKDTFQLLQQSPVKTDFFLKSLPRLPIPKLTATCERYLATQRALLADDEFKATEAVVIITICICLQ